MARVWTNHVNVNDLGSWYTTIFEYQACEIDLDSNGNCTSVKKPFQCIYIFQSLYRTLMPGHSFIRCVKSQKFKIISSYQHIFLLFQFLYVGNITSIEHNHKQVETARKGQEVCIKIEAVPGESPKMYGRHFEETDMLVSKVNFNNNNNTQCIFTYCRKSWSQYFFNRPFMIFFKL